MPSAVDHLEFGPPNPRGSLRALILAVFAHLLLIAALTWGVNWKKSDDSASSFAAELWPSNSSSQEAAPSQPMPRVIPPTPTPVAVAPPPPPPRAEDKPLMPQVDIALKEEKKRKLQLQKQREQLAKEKAQEKDRLLAEQEKQEEIEKTQRKAQLAKAEKIEKVKEAAKKAQLAQQAKEIQDNKEAKAKAKDAEKRLAQVAEKAAEEQRQQNMRRLTGMAGATGDTEGKSSNRASAGGSGSSTTYGAIVRAAIKPNVVFTDEIVGNPMAKVEVRLALDGMIISQRLVQSSGNKNWDDAALNAIIRTRVMPRDVDGRIPDTTLILEMKPRG